MASILLVVAQVSGCGDAHAHGEDREQVMITGETFRLEMAADEKSRTKGLMYREEIEEDGGMLFIFPDSKRRSFWMGYCLVDIDLIFLDPLGRITALHRMKAQPLRRPGETVEQYERRLHARGYPSRYPAQFAIELKSGWLDRLDLHVDDKIELDLKRLKAMARRDDDGVRQPPRQSGDDR